MKSQTVLNVAASVFASIAIVGGQVMPTAAQFFPPSNTQAAAQTTEGSQTTAATTSSVPNNSRLLEAQAAHNRMIPASTGVVVTFLAPVSIDVDEAAYPMTLPLTSPIYDSQGTVVAPENSPVSVMIQPGEGGATIQAQSVLINGRLMPIQATSPMIPGTTITHMRANDRAADDGATLGRITASGFGFLNGGDPDSFDQGGMLGNFVGMLAGRQDESSRIVQIPQGSVFVLPLSESIPLGQ
ncbi:MAG: hypothetical protein AAFR58_15350 [Cyanobacteria bacterium J06627_28]